jgi:hypothetical protein
MFLAQLSMLEGNCVVSSTRSKTAGVKLHRLLSEELHESVLTTSF